MKCTNCGSENVVECEVNIFEAGDFGINGALCDGFDPSLIRVFSNVCDKARLAVTGKKRYRCNKCGKFFEK